MILRQQEFELYLKTIRKLSNSSIHKYARQAHNRIQKELGFSFYALDSMKELHQLLRDVKQMESLMERNPKRMYSSAVSNYIKFQAFEMEKVYLIEDSNYNHSIEEELSSLSKSEVVVGKIIPVRPATLKDESRTIFHRDIRVAANAIRASNYLCEINPKHQYFVSRATQHNYVEAHHIVPISTQALFDNGLDNVANIACLCPVCHRKVHYGIDRDRLMLLEVLWKNKQEAIKLSGIELDYKELVTMY